MKKNNSGANTSKTIELKTILVVEDDRSHRVLLDKILQNAGFLSVLVQNGIDALEHLQRGEKYDLIIMDWDMPELDGLDTTRAIRAREQVENCKRIPILAFTACRKTGDREQCLAAGMDGYLPKDVWMPGKCRSWMDTRPLRKSANRIGARTLRSSP